MEANALLIDPATRTVEEVYWRESDPKGLLELYELLDCEGIETILVSKNGRLWVNSEAKTEKEFPMAEQRGFFVLDTEHVPAHIIGKALYQRTSVGNNRRILKLDMDAEEIMEGLRWL